MGDFDPATGGGFSSGHPGLSDNGTEYLKHDGSLYKYDEENQTLIITEPVPFQNFIYSLPDIKYDLAENFYKSVRMGAWLD
ncbi:MAG: hypothetical protein PHR86_10065, partial [Desulfobacterales bacterium]|nr:hypothetical protein [Desulfobacterales bacterium]